MQSTAGERMVVVPDREDVYDREETMGDRLRWLRMQNARYASRSDWSLRAISDAVGISKSRLSQIELDLVEFIRPDELVQLAKLYRVSTDWILGLRDTRVYLNGESPSEVKVNHLVGLALQSIQDDHR